MLLSAPWECASLEKLGDMDSVATPLWKGLRGRGCLWHRTSLDALRKIICDKQIIPNTGQFPTTTAQSTGSIARYISATSLFDFDTATEHEIYNQESKFSSVLTRYLPDVSILIGIKRDNIIESELLLPSEIHDCPRISALSEEDKLRLVYIPVVEALHLGPIQTSAFSSYIMTAFREGGGYHSHELGAASVADPVSVMLNIGGEWIADHHRRVKERHSRGEYTLAEMLEDIYARNNA